MKMNAKIVMCLLTMLCIIAGHAWAEEIYIENHSFEEPGDGKTQLLQHSETAEDTGEVFVQHQSMGRTPTRMAAGAQRETGRGHRLQGSSQIRLRDESERGQMEKCFQRYAGV